MTFKLHSAFIASLSAVALLLAASDSFARSGAAPGGGARATPPAAGHAFGHPRRNHVGGYWPAGGGYYYAPTSGEPLADAIQPASRDVRYTYTYDVPWDWAHRYPPNVVPSDRPYVSSCSAETVTVPGRNGQDKTINITRCY